MLALKNKINYLENQVNNIQDQVINIIVKLDIIQEYQRRSLKINTTQIAYIKKPLKKSVVFLYNSYYHFFYLAKALRKRGWDAISVSYENPITSLHAPFYHGEDVNLFSSDPSIFEKKIQEFYEEAKQRFDILHFAGDGLMSFFPENWAKDDPKDIIEWRSLGKKVAYTVSGCNSCISQSKFAKWSALDIGKPACDSCRWQNEPTVCSDKKNLIWGKKVNKYCDLIFAETLPALDYLDSPKTIFNPCTMCLDPELWHPELKVPGSFKIKKDKNEFLVYHAFGNYEIRTRFDGKNIKGTPAIISAIEKLKTEGIPVKLIFIHNNMKNVEIRYIQAQADIIIDQLIMGRYGATSREGMMLGKPVICYINKHEFNYNHKMDWKQEVPIISATEDTIYKVLKELLLNEERRKTISKRSREYALKWHSADSCAERYEKIWKEWYERKY